MPGPVPPARRAFVLLAALFAVHLACAGALELTGDEAYYRLWSRHLSAGYYSKGPGIAWLMALGTRLLGDSVLGVRVFAPVLSFAASWLLFVLGTRLGGSGVGWRAVWIGATVPMLHLGGILLTIDPPSVFFWVAAAFAFWRAKDTDRPGPWLATGALVGLGMLFKYTNAVQLLGFAAFCAWSPAHRRRLRARGFYAMVAAAGALLAPPLAWNARHGWITFAHLAARGALDEPFRPQPGEFLAFAASQALALSPLYFAGLLAALARRPPPGEAGTARRFLVALIAPLLLLYAAVSWNGEWEPNWTAPALAMAPLLLALDRPPGPPAGAARRAWARAAVGLAALLSAVLLGALATPAFYGDGRFRRLGGAADLARQVEAARQAHGASFVIGEGYQLASLLAFYLPGRPRTFIPEEDRVRNQFSFWPGYRGARTGESAIYVHKSPRPHPALALQFAEVRPLGEVWSAYRGRPMRRYHLYLCRGLGPPRPAR